MVPGTLKVATLPACYTELANEDTISMDTHEAYRELGVDPRVSDADLKATWRRLVAAWHPDRNAHAGAGRRMQQINKAYQHIRQVRDENQDGTEDTNPDSGETTAASASATVPEDASQHTHVRKVVLTIEEAILGCTRTLQGKMVHSCDVCHGKGQRVLAKACKTCHGSGAVHRASLFGWMWHQEACADCGGDGRQREACAPCGGSGELAAAYRRRVRFPAGVRSGHVLSVPASRTGDAGVALELEVAIEAHPLFTLDSDGVLRCEMPVNGYAWMAGRWVDVPTPNGVQLMRLNRDALAYRLGGQGFPTSLRGPRGDYIVKVVPVFPDQDDAAQEALLDKLIARTNATMQREQSQPMGQWKRRMKRWSSANAKPPRDE